MSPVDLTGEAACGRGYVFSAPKQSRLWQHPVNASLKNSVIRTTRRTSTAYPLRAALRQGSATARDRPLLTPKRSQTLPQRFLLRSSLTYKPSRTPFRNTLT